MIWPVPLRGSIRSTATASSSEATSLSMPNSAMCTGGSVVVRSALPSLVTRTMVPVSAIARLAPEMPTVASMNFSRSDSRAWRWMASTVASVPKTLAASSFVRWMAGAIRCEGCVCVSCTIRSPRSVSTTSIPRPSRCSFSPISSLAIDLLLVTTIRLPDGNAVPAFEQIWPMMARASAASFAKWTSPPTAVRRSVNCAASSGRRSRFAWRLAFSSARPASKSKLSNAALRRPRRPVIAWISAFCRFWLSSARSTRRAKWPRDSGTRRSCFFDGLRHRGWCRHRRQAYGSDADHGALIARLEHRVGMRRQSCPRERGAACCDFDPVSQPVERAAERGRHQAVLPRQGGDRLERAARPLPVRQVGVTAHDVELDQGHGGDGVLRQRLDAFAEAPELLGSGVVEVAADLAVREPALQVRRQILRDVEPLFTKSVLMRANRGPKRPHLVRELTTNALRMRHALTAAVCMLEQ